MPDWFVVNTADAQWEQMEPAGRWVHYEREQRFPHFGINIHVVEPGQANAMYHREDTQEAFLVLHGECLLIVEEQEVPMRQWDFFHCAPGTAHVIVGAGDGPCAVLMVGSRHLGDDDGIEYPRSELASRHGAGVARTTSSPAEAYAGWGDARPIDDAPWPL